jgi:hypothetical protein
MLRRQYTPMIARLPEKIAEEEEIIDDTIAQMRIPYTVYKISDNSNRDSLINEIIRIQSQKQLWYGTIKIISISVDDDDRDGIKLMLQSSRITRYRDMKKIDFLNQIIFYNDVILFLTDQMHSITTSRIIRFQNLENILKLTSYSFTFKPFAEFINIEEIRKIIGKQIFKNTKPINKIQINLLNLRLLKKPITLQFFCVYGKITQISFLEDSTKLVLVINDQTYIIDIDKFKDCLYFINKNKILLHDTETDLPTINTKIDSLIEFLNQIMVKKPVTMPPKLSLGAPISRPDNVKYVNTRKIFTTGKPLSGSKLLIARRIIDRDPKIPKIPARIYSEASLKIITDYFLKNIKRNIGFISQKIQNGKITQRGDIDLEIERIKIRNEYPILNKNIEEIRNTLYEELEQKQRRGGNKIKKITRKVYLDDKGKSYVKYDNIKIYLKMY